MYVYMYIFIYVYIYIYLYTCHIFCPSILLWLFLMVFDGCIVESTAFRERVAAVGKHQLSNSKHSLHSLGNFLFVIEL